MNWLSEFDHVKTPESWIDETLDMTVGRKESWDNKDARGKKSNIMKTRRNSTGRMAGNFVKAAVAVGVLIAVSGGSVYAYNYYMGKYAMNNTASSLNHFDGGVDDQGNPYTYEGAQSVKETAVSSQDILIVESTDMVTEAHKAVIRFTVKTKDGSSLVNNDETKVSYPSRQKFKTVNVKVGGEQIFSDGGLTSRIYAQRVDDASVPSEAVFELTISDANVDFAGKDISVSLTDYTDSWSVMSDIGFKFDSVADLVAVGKIADINGFDVVEEKGYYANGASKLSYVLKPGTQKIAFSDKYPDAYIDNIGFAPRSDYDKKDTFYMTIVPGSASETLRKLAFLNKTTGRMYNDHEFAYKILDDGRIQIAVSANVDRQYSKTNDGIYIDTTLEHLKNYKLILNNPDKEPTDGTRYAGTWTMTLKSDASKMIEDKVLKDIELPKESVDEYQVYKIKLLTLNDTEFKVEFMITDEWQKNDSKENSYFSKFAKSIVIVMKDGKRITLGNKIGGGYGGWSDREADAVLEALLQSFINSNDVEKLEIAGCTFKFE